MFGISDNKRNASTCNLINDKGAMNNDNIFNNVFTDNVF